jgi:uncharacterized protein (TIGR01777 family)
MRRDFHWKNNSTMNQKRIVIAGGSGFIGTALAKELIARDYEVIVLTRSPSERGDGIREEEWDGEHLGEWIKFLDGAVAIINLTGKNINCPHTAGNLRAITESRVTSVNAIAAAILHVKTPPQVWVQAGAIGIYGDTRHHLCDESSPAGNDALAGVCKLWEGAFDSAKTPATRKVLLRIGFVLGRDGGALPVLEKLTKCFLGGSAGSGGQFISWIHIADLTRMFVEAIERAALSGTFNVVVPQPVTNQEFMRELRRALYRPWSPPVPELAVRLGAWLMDSEPSLALDSQRCAPKHFLGAGFEFQFSELRPALENLFE